MSPAKQARKHLMKTQNSTGPFSPDPHENEPES